MDTLTDFVNKTAAEFGITGAAAGVWADGKETYACYGMTSIENPLPVDRDTLFTLGSVTKTFTATALMRLVAEGKVDLNVPVRRYVPELNLKDEQTAASITVLNLLNHTAGLDWGLFSDTGEGDDGLAAYVAQMSELALIAPPGVRTSYSQAGYNLVGRIIEKVTGLTFEQAVAALVFEPLGLNHTFFSRDAVMTRRFAVGHNRDEDGTLSIARLWKGWRADNPGGGLASSVADQLRWARFHLGDGRTENGIPVLPAEVLHQMKQPTAVLQGSSLGDAIGIAWFLRDINGVRAVGHAGSASGQFAELLTVPERGFAVVSLSNTSPNGIPFNHAVIRWALQHFLGIIDRDPEPLPYDEVRTQQLAGAYENEVMTLVITTDGTGMKMDVRIKPEIRAALSADKEVPPDHAPADFGLLPGDADEYVITSGGMKGLRGFFSRDADGTIIGVDVAGRLFNRA
jgi:CubicO group peptidase (beta-lactamase class C family)